MSLFDLVSDEDRQSFELKYPNVGEYDAEEALAYEKRGAWHLFKRTPSGKICSYPKEKTSQQMR